MPHDEMLAELDRRRAHASAMGGEKKLAGRRERGVLNAWERLSCLVDDGSFVETGLLGASGMFPEDVEKTPRDGKIAGFARIDGRDVAVCVNDFTVKGASTSATNSKKMGHIRRVATEKGFPFVHIGESTGARLPDAMGARGMGLLLGNDPTQFRRTRESPWAAAALDASFGSSAWLCCVSDFAALLDGARGAGAVSRGAIVDALLKIGGEGGLMLREAAIAEIDVNPMIVTAGGAVAVDARVILRRAADAAATPGPVADRPRDDLPALERFRPLFHPRTVAVIGASATTPTIGDTFIRRMQAFGYPGAIYPIHPKAAHIEGLPAYPSLGETPAPVDYAYVAIGAERVPALVGAAAGNIAFTQVISSGFREEGNAGLEDRLVAAAHAGGTRLVGPNCLGTYSPRGRSLTFPIDAPTEPGRIGIVTQSGGLGTDIIKRGQWKGLGLSALVTAGNCADVGPTDLVEYYLADDGTEAIGLYLEDIGDGRRFFDLLRGTARPKPVVVLRGGRSDLGRAAAKSHTGALAGDARAWRALAAQTPVALVDTVGEFLDTLVVLQYLTLRPERPTASVALFGNGGGTGVLATDFFAERGLAVRRFDGAAKDALLALGLPPGTSVANPVDAPVITLPTDEGRIANEILDIIYRHARPDAVVMHLNLAAFVGRAGVDPVDNLIGAAVTIGRAYPGQAHFALALRVDGSPELDDAKRRYRGLARDAGIAVFDELPEVARALAAVGHLERALAGGNRSTARGSPR